MTPEDVSNLQVVHRITTAELFRQNREAFNRFMEFLYNYRDICTPFARAHILRIRNMLHRELSNSQSFDTGPFVAALGAHNTTIAIAIATAMISSCQEPPEVQQLGAMLDRFPFEAGKAYVGTLNDARLGRAVLGKEMAVDQVEVSKRFDGSETFVCPILYEEEIDPIILVSVPRRPILAGFSRSDTGELIDCPLTALLSARFMHQLTESIDHVISLTAYREAAACGHPVVTSPLTRKKVLGAMTLGCHPSHVQATNWTLFQLFSGGKRLGNPDLWFALVWLLVEDGKIPYLTEILPFIRAHMLYRLKNSQTYASLTGLPDYVNYRVPLGAACWFSLASVMCKNCTPQKDTLRIHMRHTRPLFRLCELIGYEIPEEVGIYNKRLRVLITLKMLATRDFVRLQGLIRALTQKCVFLEHTHPNVVKREKNYVSLIPIDGAADDAQRERVLNMLPKWCRDIPLEDVIGIANLITSPSIALRDVRMDVNWVPPALPEVVCDWSHYSGKADRLPDFSICAKTMHPFYTITTAPNASFCAQTLTWKQSLARVIGPGTKIFSECHYYGLFVNKYHAYPQRDDLLAFIWARYANNHFARTLPEQCVEIVEKCLDKFLAVTMDVSPMQCAKRFIKAQNVPRRQRLETSIDMIDD